VEEEKERAGWDGFRRREREDELWARDGSIEVLKGREQTMWEALGK
jgi:hypothetical protein